MNPGKADRIVRYTAGTRINHWVVAISFVLLALSGLALFHPALFWLTNLFGGGPWTRILHPFIGCVMVAAFYLLGVHFWRDNLMQPRDWVWLRKINDVVGNHEENLALVGGIKRLLGITQGRKDQIGGGKVLRRGPHASLERESAKSSENRLPFQRSRTTRIAQCPCKL